MAASVTPAKRQKFSWGKVERYLFWLSSQTITLSASAKKTTVVLLHDWIEQRRK